MIRATLDVNVLASGFLEKQASPAVIVQRWTEGWFELVLSEHILRGLERAWQKPYLRTRYTAGQVQQTLTRLRAESFLTIPAASVHGVAEDEEDDLVLATAVAGYADYLVTGDKHLQSLFTYESVAIEPYRQSREITIVSPRRFLEILDLDPNG